MTPISSSRLYPINNTFSELDDDVDVPAPKRQCTGELPSSNAITSLSEEYLRQLDTALENLKISENSAEGAALLNAHLEQFPPLESLTAKERFETGVKLFESNIDVVRAHKLLHSAVNDLYIPALQYVNGDTSHKMRALYNSIGLLCPFIDERIYLLARGQINYFPAHRIDKHNLALFQKALELAHLKQVFVNEIKLPNPLSLMHSIFNNKHKFTNLTFNQSVFSVSPDNKWSVSELVEIGQALSNNTTLETLEINHYIFSDEWINTIASSLTNHKSLKHLNIRNSQVSLSAASTLGMMLPFNETVTHLTLSNCSLSRKAISKIASGLRDNFSLKALDLSLNSLMNREVTILADALLKNSTLQSLHLKETRFQLDDLINLSSLYAPEAPRNTTLTHLDLSRVKLNYKNETPERLRNPFIRFFSHYSPLKSLTLASCDINASHIPVFDTHTPCNTNLTRLNLTENELNQQSLISLSNILTKITSLTLLYLNGNKLGINEDNTPATNGGVDPLCEILRTNTSITSLKISACQLRREGIPKLKNAVFATMIRKPLASLSPVTAPSKLITEFKEFVERNKHNHKMKKRTLYDLLVKSLSKELLYD